MEFGRFATGMAAIIARTSGHIEKFSACLKVGVIDFGKHGIERGHESIWVGEISRTEKYDGICAIKRWNTPGDGQESYRNACNPIIAEFERSNANTIDGEQQVNHKHQSAIKIGTHKGGLFALAVPKISEEDSVNWILTISIWKARGERGGSDSLQL